jgi:hypothetical protein
MLVEMFMWVMPPMMMMMMLLFTASLWAVGMLLACGMPLGVVLEHGPRITGDIPANGAIAFGNAAVADDDASLYNMPSDNALSPIKVCSLVSIIPVSRTTLIGPCIGSIRMLTWSKDEAQRDETQPACCCFELVLLRTQMTAMLRREPLSHAADVPRG